MIRRFETVVSGDRSGERLDRFLQALFPSHPPKSIRHVLEGGRVFLGGSPARKGTILEGGERILVLDLPGEEDWLPAPEDLPGASLLYEDGHVVVLEKPARVHTEPHAPREGGTLAGYLLYRFPRVADVSRRPGLTLVSRLDYDTSGAVTGALTAEGLVHLGREGEGGRILKRYACVVEGDVASEMVLADRIDAEGGGKVRVRNGRRDEDPARWTRVVPVCSPSPGRTLLRAEIRRGKRHQIRAHLAASGHPIVGDALYGAGARREEGRLLLHAETVTFRRLGGGEETVVCPMPPEFLGPST